MEGLIVVAVVVVDMLAVVSAVKTIVQVFQANEKKVRQHRDRMQEQEKKE
jgi:hypothetical protein